MHTTRRILTSSLAVAAIAAAGAAATAAPASAQDEMLNQRFVIIASGLTGSGRLIATGPISGAGTDTLLDHGLNPDGTFTDTDRFDLPSGQVFLRDTYTASATSNPNTCVTKITVAGTYLITGGTGDYAGARGDGTFTAAGTSVAGRTDSGDCQGPDSTPMTFHEIVRGVGVTTLT